MQYIHIFFCFLTCSSDQAPNPECKRSVNFEMYFWYLQFFQKQMKKFDFTTMVPQVELLSFVFWGN